MSRKVNQMQELDNGRFVKAPEKAKPRSYEALIKALDETVILMEAEEYRLLVGTAIDDTMKN